MAEPSTTRTEAPGPPHNPRPVKRRKCLAQDDFINRTRRELNSGVCKASNNDWINIVPSPSPRFSMGDRKVDEACLVSSTPLLSILSSTCRHRSGATVNLDLDGNTGIASTSTTSSDVLEQAKIETLASTPIAIVPQLDVQSCDGTYRQARLLNRIPILSKFTRVRINPTAPSEFDSLRTQSKLREEVSRTSTIEAVAALLHTYEGHIWCLRAMATRSASWSTMCGYNVDCLHVTVSTTLSRSTQGERDDRVISQLITVRGI
jgi:hypothetical protein